VAADYLLWPMAKPDYSQFEYGSYVSLTRKEYDNGRSEPSSRLDNIAAACFVLWYHTVSDTL
jgi:hypothetical protein